MSQFATSQPSQPSQPSSPPALHIVYQGPGPTPWIQTKTHRMIIIGVAVGLVVILTTLLVVYMLVIFPKVKYGNQVMVTTVQQINQPSVRYSLGMSSPTSGANVTLQPNGRTRFVLKPVKTSQKGNIKTGDHFILYEPSSKMYLRYIACPKMTTETCTSNMKPDGSGAACQLNTAKTACTYVDNYPNFIFQGLPKDFYKNPSDVMNKEFIFYFTDCTQKVDSKTKDKTLTCSKSSTIVKTKHQYLLQSILTGNVIHADMSHKTLIDESFTDAQKSQWNVFWTLIK
jgi:hypothetical protein